MNQLTHLGFDVSTTGAAATLLDADGLLIKAWIWQAHREIEGAEHVDQRIHAIGQWAEATFWDTRMNIGDRFLSCSIESPFFRGAGSAPLAEAQGAVKSRWETQWAKFKPAQVKATAAKLSGIVTSGKRAGKEPMRVALAVVDSSFSTIEKMFDVMARATASPAKAMGDLCDSYWVARTDLETVKGNL